MNEDAYKESSVRVGKTIENGSFRITVERVGYYTIDYVGEDKKLFRVDLAITNIGSEPEYLPSDYVILDKEGNQYDRDYNGTKEYKNVYPGVTVRGYQTFDAMKESTTELILHITKNSFPHDFSWEFAIPSAK